MGVFEKRRRSKERRPSQSLFCRPPPPTPPPPLSHRFHPSPSRRRGGENGSSSAAVVSSSGLRSFLSRQVAPSSPTATPTSTSAPILARIPSSYYRYAPSTQPVSELETCRQQYRQLDTKHQHLEAKYKQLETKHQQLETKHKQLQITKTNPEAQLAVCKTQISEWESKYKRLETGTRDAIAYSQNKINQARQDFAKTVIARWREFFGQTMAKIYSERLGQCLPAGAIRVRGTLEAPIRNLSEYVQERIRPYRHRLFPVQIDDIERAAKQADQQLEEFVSELQRGIYIAPGPRETRKPVPFDQPGQVVDAIRIYSGTYQLNNLNGLDQLIETTLQPPRTDVDRDRRNATCQLFTDAVRRGQATCPSQCETIRTGYLSNRPSCVYPTRPIRDQPCALQPVAFVSSTPAVAVK